MGSLVNPLIMFAKLRFIGEKPFFSLTFLGFFSYLYNIRW